MPESACIRCGRLCPHTADDERPLCEICMQVEVWDRIVWDVLEGRLDGEEVLRTMAKKEAPPE